MSISDMEKETVFKNSLIFLDKYNHSNCLFHCDNAVMSLKTYIDKQHLVFFFIDKSNYNNYLFSVVQKDGDMFLEYEYKNKEQFKLLVRLNSNYVYDDGVNKFIINPKEKEIVKSFLEKEKITYDLKKSLSEIDNTLAIKFLKHINIDNYKDYVHVIDKNDQQLKNFLTATVFAQEYHLDIFNMKKEDKDLLKLRTGIKFNFDTGIEKSFLDKIKSFYKK